MTLMGFSMIPLDQGPSFSRHVAGILSIVEDSGMDYRLNSMGTVVEGEWDELLAVLSRCFRHLEKESERISVHVTFDHRKGLSNALEKKLRSVEEKAGRDFRT